MIKRFDILPGYRDGFVFTWELTPDVVVPDGVTYAVQKGDTVDGPWTSISPALQDVFVWESSLRVVAPRAPVLYYRLEITAGSTVTHSDVRQPYGDLNRREFLLLRNMRRHELLQMTGMAGKEYQLYKRALFGPRCDVCTDFVSGRVVNTNCSTCYGTGRKPGYHGPYVTWAILTPEKRRPNMRDGSPSVRQDNVFNARMLGVPSPVKYDLLVEKGTDRRYLVDGVESLAELRRIPIAQMVEVSEIPVTDKLYEVGNDA